MESLWKIYFIQSLWVLVFSLELTIVHYSDLHTKFLPIDREARDCSKEENERQECFGGFARLKYKIDDIRRNRKNVLLLNAGDYFTGSVWYTIYGWKVVDNFLRQLDHTAMALGIHEFDDVGLALVPFLENFTHTPILSANIDASNVTMMEGKFNKSIVVEIEGVKIGIIGYTSQEVMVLASPGALEFNDVLESVEEESKQLTEKGVKIIIALGHAGFNIDKHIAALPFVDIVVGGRSDSLLYTGTEPEAEIKSGPYPYVVQSNQVKESHVGLVVHAFSYGKYLGVLNVEFDVGTGIPVSWSGNPILLDNTVNQDPKVLKELTEWDQNITAILQQEVGSTKVYLDGRYMICRTRECNMGNVLADSLVNMALKYANDFEWNYASIAILTSGGIRDSIEERNQGIITMGDIYQVLPYRNAIEFILIRGEILREVFEYSIHDYDPVNEFPSGKFLQSSGVELVFDVCQPVGQRIKEIYVLCNECRVPTYLDLDDSTYYKVIVPTFLAEGGDGYSMIPQNIMSRSPSGLIDSDILIQYMKDRGPIITGVEHRVLIEMQNNCVNEVSSVLVECKNVIIRLLITLSVPFYRSCQTWT